MLGNLFVRFAKFFGAQDVPERAAQEERRAANRAVVVIVLVAIFIVEGVTTPSRPFPFVDIGLLCAFGLASLIYALQLRRNPDSGTTLLYTFAVVDPFGLTFALGRDPRSVAFLSPLLLTLIVGVGMRYGSRTMYLVWFATLTGLLLVFTVEPYARSLELTTPSALALALVPLFFSNLVRQIHRAKAIEAEKVRVEAMNEAVVARGAFLARVSHEIRSPLQGVVSALDLFEMRFGVREDGHELIGRLRRSSLLLSRQLRDMLTLAKGQAGRLQMNPEPFELLALVEGVADEARPLATDKGLQLIVDVPEEPMFVLADGARIDQVLTNLVVNSIRFTDAGHVRIQLEPYDARLANLCFVVSDTGPGIPESVIPTLFDPDRTFSESDRRGGGSGIGLAIVRTLLEHLGGSVVVASRSDVGTTFTIRIPAPPVHRQEDSPGQVKGRVLVVDDRIDVLEAMIDVIEELGFECDKASTPSMGASLLATKPYVVAFIDIDMPLKRGDQLVAEVRQGQGPNREIRFIGMSAAEVTETMARNFHACLAKPVDRTVILEALVNASSPAARGQNDPAARLRS